jgi:hypothetical protein
LRIYQEVVLFSRGSPARKQLVVLGQHSDRDGDAHGRNNTGRRQNSRDGDDGRNAGRRDDPSGVGHERSDDDDFRRKLAQGAARGLTGRLNFGSTLGTVTKFGPCQFFVTRSRRASIHTIASALCASLLEPAISSAFVT